jgi:hypothetical protein
VSEYILDDGRKAERVENNPDSMTKVTEVYVEPKQRKRLSQRITEKFCVCEREVETIDEDTGEIVDRFVENLCGHGEVTMSSGVKSPIQMAVEKKMKVGANKAAVVFGAVVVAQVLALVYVLFFM